MYIYIHIYISTCIYLHVYIYTYIFLIGVCFNVPASPATVGGNGWSSIVEQTNKNKRSVVIKFEFDALGVITISRGCFERCGSNNKTPPIDSPYLF